MSFELPMAAPQPAHAAGRRDAGWHRAARAAVLLSWLSLAYMGVEGGVGVWQGFAAGSVALAGWGLASFIEGVASAVVIWRFTGSRRLSETAEARAQRLVALQFFVLAPYVLVESVKTLAERGHPDVTVVGMALTATSVVSMPVLGVAKRRLAQRLGSSATAGEGTQNVLCGAQAAAVLVGLGANAAVGAWWLDPLIGLLIAGVAVKEGREAWRGETCADCASPLAATTGCEEDCCAPALAGACSLDAAGFDERMAVAAELGRDALVSRHRTGASARLVFRRSASVQRRLRDVVAAEAGCCAFLELRLTDRDDVVELSIDADREAERAVRDFADAFAADR